MSCCKIKHKYRNVHCNNAQIVTILFYYDTQNADNRFRSPFTVQKKNTWAYKKQNNHSESLETTTLPTRVVGKKISFQILFSLCINKGI